MFVSHRRFLRTCYETTCFPNHNIDRAVSIAGGCSRNQRTLRRGNWACTSHRYCSATTDESALAKDALDILTRMTDFISGEPAFSLVSDTGHEVMHKNGQLIEFGSRLTLTIQRPSQAIGRFDSRDGDSSTTVLDGEAIWVYSAKENMYDTTRQPGDIDASLDFLAKQLGVPRQLRDFFPRT